MEIRVGDTVRRNMAGVLMDLRVTDVTPERIICGAWEFDRALGYEIDEELGWGIPGVDGAIRTGSFIEAKP